MNDAKVTDGEVIEAEHQVERGQDLVPSMAPATAMALPEPSFVSESMERVGGIANSLKQFVQQQGLTVKIGQSDHIRVEGWQILGPFLGVKPDTESHPIEQENDSGWEARTLLRDKVTGDVMGTGDAMCMRSEQRWKSADDNAIRSMAQTRSIGKAFRNTYGFIAKAAGFEPTPAEEMEAHAANAVAAKPAPSVKADKPKQSKTLATQKQVGLMNARANAAGLSDEQRKAIIEWTAETDSSARVPKKDVDAVLQAFERSADVIKTILDTAELGNPQAQELVKKYGLE